ncbi:MAG TPA: hypothetical protein VGN42_04950 [Pirellulales bacterium]|jgi:hypothetical protein|nr:hypothetical protein [Pirellulales bacterium]
MGTRERLAAFFLALLTIATAAGADLQSVGALGRRDRLAIEGAKAFSPDEIREALFNELDVVAACRSDAPLAELTATIADKAAAGYRGAGFFDAAVSVVVAGDKLAVTIEEGERFANGEIVVSGNRQLDAEQIKTDLARPEATRVIRPRPSWRTMQPASFSPETEARLMSKALASVEDQGFYRAKLKANVEPDRSTMRATLRIEIREEGPMSTLGDIAMEGAERNSREAVVAYLGVDRSTPLTRELRERIERRLLGSGRFTQVRWELGEPRERGAAWRPRLALQEYELAPPIDKPLSRDEAALLKMAEWFERLEDSNEEILFCDGAGKNLFVFAPQRGFIVLTNRREDDAAANDRPAFGYAVVMDEERVGLYSGSQRRKLVAVPPPSPVVGEAVISLIGGAPKWDSQSELKLGAGLSTETHKGYRRHMKVQLKLSATAALSVLYKHKANCRWEGDVLCLEWGECQLRTNSLTGQLIESVVKAASPDEGAPAEIGSRIVVKPGEFERRLLEIEKASADWPDVADPRRPLSCVGEFLCREIEQFNADVQRRADDEFAKEFGQELRAKLSERYAREQRGYAALGKAISLGMLSPFDRLLCQAIQPREERFSIPMPAFEIRVRSLDELPSVVRELAPLFGVRVGNFLFPTDGWMNAAWRQGLFAASKKRIAMMADLRNVFHDRRGPLRSLASAELLRAGGADFESKMHALRGLHNWPLAAFRDECRELASGQGFASELLLTIAATMRQFDAADVEALAGLLVEFKLLGETQAAALEFAALRAREEDSPSQAVAQALHALWRAGLSDWIERRRAELGSPAEKPEGR